MTAAQKTPPDSLESKVQAFRELVFAGIKKALEEDGHCKSYEGEISLTWPNYFGNHNSLSRALTDSIPDGEYVVRLHCYVLGPARYYEWYGASFDECFAKATEDVQKWIAELEEDA